MKYEYFCESCQKVIEKDFPFGKPKKQVCCECGEKAERYLGNVSFVLKGGGWPSRSERMKNEQTAKNKAAGKRMKKTWPDASPHLVDQG